MKAYPARYPLGTTDAARAMELYHLLHFFNISNPLTEADLDLKSPLSKMWNAYWAACKELGMSFENETHPLDYMNFLQIDLMSPWQNCFWQSTNLRIPRIHSNIDPELVERTTHAEARAARENVYRIEAEQKLERLREKVCELYHQGSITYAEFNEIEDAMSEP